MDFQYIYFQSEEDKFVYKIALKKRNHIGIKSLERSKE